MNTGINGVHELTADEITVVAGGLLRDVVIIGCTTPRPMGGYPPGTIVWNPWLTPFPVLI